jgi:L-alanine-DL-glutamate epimerase-like enolase superfamily enzyme
MIGIRRAKRTREEAEEGLERRAGNRGPRTREVGPAAGVSAAAMKIVDIRETTVSLAAPIRNADIGFEAMTASAVAVVTDRMAGGRPLAGLGFDSIGRYGHGGLLRERFIPRLLAADPADYAAARGDAVDPLRASAVMMRDEKAGGHGERAGAVGVLDAALWDLVAKAEGMPLWRVLADRFNGGDALARVPVYASGGHYRDGDEAALLGAELRGYAERGYRRFKIKVGGAPIARDQARIEAALGVAGTGAALAVDGNGAADRDAAFALLGALAPYGLAWFEEPCDPLDYEVLSALSQADLLPIATGENVFSAADTRNLLRYGGLRPARDWLQVDISLAYGVPEYLEIVALLEAAGWSRTRLMPHAGHLFSFHVVAGLGLGSHESAPDDALVFGGYPAGVAVEDGHVRPWDAAGVGFERKANLRRVFQPLIG